MKIDDCKFERAVIISWTGVKSKSQSLAPEDSVVKGLPTLHSFLKCAMNFISQAFV